MVTALVAVSPLLLTLWPYPDTHGQESANGHILSGPKPATPPPPTWPDSTVIAALAECTRLLAPISVEVDTLPPLREGDCGTPAPVRLKRIAGIEISPPVVVNCPIVAHLHEWVHGVLEPAGHTLTTARIRRLQTLSGYSCRNRIGSTKQVASQHATANAVDIAAVEFTDGLRVEVKSDWSGLAPSTAPAPAIATAPAKVPGTSDRSASAPAKAAFLHRLHDAACGTFSTVLGPDTNEEHRDHLHFDLQPRRGRAWCE